MYSLEDIGRHGFVEHGPASLKLTQDGRLSDLSFAAKDLMDVAGFNQAGAIRIDCATQLPRLRPRPPCFPC